MTHVRPLTGAFFSCVVSFIHMDTPLMFRPVNVRLNVAYIIDTVLDTPSCDPGNTVSRTFNDGIHEYARMWNRIQTIYSQCGWNALTDSEINDVYKSMISSDTQFRGRTVTPMDIMRTKQRWTQRGWSRYETKRNARRDVARKYGGYAVMAVGLCFGIVMPNP